MSSKLRRHTPQEAPNAAEPGKNDAERICEPRLPLTKNSIRLLTSEMRLDKHAKLKELR